MLRQDVVEAAADGKFKIYPVETIDQGIELLTGVTAGVADSENKFPPDTINGLVQATLEKFSNSAQAFATGANVLDGRQQ